jgi:hypothetical protein
MSAIRIFNVEAGLPTLDEMWKYQNATGSVEGGIHSVYSNPLASGISVQDHRPMHTCGFVEVRN